MQDINLAISCMRLLHSHLDEWTNNANVLKDMTEQQQANWIQALFLLSLVWSVGGGSDEDGRKKFDACLRKLLVNDVPPELKLYVTHPAVKITAPFPEGRLVRATEMHSLHFKYITTVLHDDDDLRSSMKVAKNLT